MTGTQNQDPPPRISPNGQRNGMHSGRPFSTNVATSPTSPLSAPRGVIRRPSPEAHRRRPGGSPATRRRKAKRLRSTILVAALPAVCLGAAACGVGSGSVSPGTTSASSASTTMWACPWYGSASPVYAESSKNSAVVDRLEYGDSVSVLHVHRGWASLEGLASVLYTRIEWLSEEPCKPGGW